MITIKRNESGLWGISAALPAPQKAVKRPIQIEVRRMPEEFEVHTLEGVMRGKAGDWLMTGAAGEMYPCDAAIFDRTYWLVDGDGPGERAVTAVEP